jgi:hypothetical protein
MQIDYTYWDSAPPFQPSSILKLSLCIVLMNVLI